MDCIHDRFVQDLAKKVCASHWVIMMSKKPPHIDEKGKVIRTSEELALDYMQEIIDRETCNVQTLKLSNPVKCPVVGEWRFGYIYAYPRTRIVCFPHSPGAHVYHMTRVAEATGEVICLLKMVGLAKEYRKQGMIYKKTDNCQRSWMQHVKEIKDMMEKLQDRMISMETEVWMLRTELEGMATIPWRLIYKTV